VATAARSMRNMAVRSARTAVRSARAVATRSVGEVAKDLGVSPSTVRNWVEKGYIHAFRLPSGVRRIPQDEVTRLVNEYFAPAPPMVGPDEPTLTLREDRDETVWGTVPTDSSGRPWSG
jgi:excisionase family DNA binding protein